MIVIVGGSASGKSTLSRDLAAYDSEYRRVVTYTTRPKRDNEVDGVDYHFVTKERFEELRKQGFFAECNVYREWWYGTAAEDCVDNDHVIAVLTPAGLRELVRRGVKVMSVYLYVSRKARLIASLKRGDNVDEAYRRNLSDVGQFDAVEDEVTAVIDNADMELTEASVLNILLRIIKAYKDGELK